MKSKVTSSGMTTEFIKYLKIYYLIELPEQTYFNVK